MEIHSVDKETEEAQHNHFTLRKKVYCLECGCYYRDLSEYARYHPDCDADMESSESLRILQKVVAP